MTYDEWIASSPNVSDSAEVENFRKWIAAIDGGKRGEDAYAEVYGEVMFDAKKRDGTT